MTLHTCQHQRDAQHGQHKTLESEARVAKFLAYRDGGIGDLRKPVSHPDVLRPLAGEEKGKPAGARADERRVEVSWGCGQLTSPPSWYSGL